MSKTRKIVLISMMMVTAATAWFMSDWNRDLPETGHGEDVPVPTLHRVETSPFTRADADRDPEDLSPNSKVADDDANDLPADYQSGRVRGFVRTDVGHSASNVTVVLRRISVLCETLSTRPKQPLWVNE